MQPVVIGTYPNGEDVSSTTSNTGCEHHSRSARTEEGLHFALHFYFQLAPLPTSEAVAPKLQSNLRTRKTPSTRANLHDIDYHKI
eukprot:6179208-Pleurochrysis_carterae.AAC.3